MGGAAAFRLVREGTLEPPKAMPADLADAAPLGPDLGARRLWRRRLLRGLAAEALGAHPDTVEIARDAKGMVRITGPKPLHASLSGRGKWTALAVAAHPVGVDVEVDPPDREPPFDLLQPLEQETILADPQSVRLFLRFWTAREAYLKAEGRGLDVMPGEVRAARRGEEVALIEAGRPIVFARIVERDDAIAAIVELPPEA
jgi:4'-phosphopantetheinyl transferase